MKKIFLIAIWLAMCFSLASVSSQPRPLSLDEDNSTVRNLTTRESWSYRDFISLIHTEMVVFNAGDELQFEFIFRNEQPTANVPMSYRLHLLTELSNPCWLYETPSASKKQCDNTWDVWNSFDDHRLGFFRITLTGTVPPPLKEKIFQPGFGEEFELSGIVRKSVRTTVDLFDGKDSIQSFTEDLVFYSTTQTLESMMSETSRLLEESMEFDSILNSGFENSSISFDTLREDIRKLGEEGNPGWSKILAEDFNNIYQINKKIVPYKCDSCCEPPPTPWGLIMPLALVFAVIGLGAGYMLKRTYVPYKELDDAREMIEDIKNKVQVIGYRISDPELQRLSDTAIKDLANLHTKTSMIHDLITKKESRMGSGMAGEEDEH